MSDAEREYDELIKNMENEVLALKTAHQRPLGALNFFMKTRNFNVNLTDIGIGLYVARITIVVSIATPAVKPPIVQTGWDTPAGFQRLENRGLSVSQDYSTWEYSIILMSDTIASTTMKVSTLSSQPINSITWSYT